MMKVLLALGLALALAGCGGYITPNLNVGVGFQGGGGYGGGGGYYHHRPYWGGGGGRWHRRGWY